MTNQAQILQGCKQNNRVSQEKLYLQFYPVLSALCRRFFDDEHEIITALNNGMLRIFKNIAQYDTTKSELVTWMYAIVRNEALTLVRNKKTVMNVDELTTEYHDEKATNPFAHKAADEVPKYLSKLPPATRAVFNLYYLEGYNIKQISIALEMKEGTVKWHLSDGRKKLQSFFKLNNDRITNAH